MFATLHETTPTSGRPAMHPSWCEPWLPAIEGAWLADDCEDLPDCGDGGEYAVADGDGHGELES